MFLTFADPFRNPLVSESSEGAYEISEEKLLYAFVHRIRLIVTLLLVCHLRFPVAFCKSFFPSAVICVLPHKQFGCQMVNAGICASSLIATKCCGP